MGTALGRCDTGELRIGDQIADLPLGRERNVGRVTGYHKSGESDVRDERPPVMCRNVEDEVGGVTTIERRALRNEPVQQAQLNPGLTHIG